MNDTIVLKFGGSSVANNESSENYRAMFKKEKWMH